MLDATKSQRSPRETGSKPTQSAAVSEEVVRLHGRLTELESEVERLLESQSQLRAIVSHLNEGLFLMDPHGVILLANAQSERLLQTPASQLIGNTTHAPGWNLLQEDGSPMPAEGHPADLVIHSHLPHHGVIAGLVLPGGEVRWLRCSATPIFHDDGTTLSNILCTFSDFTDRVLAESQVEWRMRTISSYAADLEEGKRQLELANARLEALATTDGLTGLMNHRAFQERADYEFKRARRYETPMSMLLIDVDKFKSYNDSFGHQAGDAVLRAVADTLLATGRSTDWLARYGGEEFVVILPETPITPALDAAERFRAAINSRALGSRELSISVGVASLSVGHAKPSELLEDADRALYHAKECGRNRVAWVDPTSGALSAGV